MGFIPDGGAPSRRKGRLGSATTILRGWFSFPLRSNNFVTRVPLVSTDSASRYTLRPSVTGKPSGSVAMAGLAARQAANAAAKEVRAKAATERARGEMGVMLMADNFVVLGLACP